MYKEVMDKFTSLCHVKVVGQLLLPSFDAKLIKEGSKIDICKHSGAKLSPNIKFATSINHQTSYKANVRIHGVHSGTFDGHVISFLTESNRRANASHEFKNGGLS
ncbi:hypothetical protein PIB30_004684 [Stylosanthes scabra]|uniref:Uncharacterized protein n=1 Tax=Stylosanthes scabra TaxID=79078 RepID=A0ABU6R489_9FABA|nr:hypothetical protein [Stylosanthes scabra]